MVRVVSAVRRKLWRWEIRALSKAHLAVYRVSRGRVHWSLNLEQTSRGVVQIGTNRFVVTARLASGKKRERLWGVITATYAGYAATKNGLREAYRWCSSHPNART